MAWGPASSSGRANRPPGAVRPPPSAQRGGRWWPLRPTGFALVLMCFALPFLATSCSTPGGYGQVIQGGSESYSGYDLAFGQVPSRTSELLPPTQWRADTLGWQPLLVLALLCVVAGLVLPLVIRRAPLRERASLAAGGLALLITVVGSIVAKEILAQRIYANARSRHLSLKYDAIAYVVHGQGLVLAVVILLAIVATEVSLLRARYRIAHPLPPTPEPSIHLPPQATAGWTSEPSSPPTPPRPPPSSNGRSPSPRTVGAPWRTGAGDAGPATAGAAPSSPPNAEPRGAPSPPTDPAGAAG